MGADFRRSRIPSGKIVDLRKGNAMTQEIELAQGGSIARTNDSVYLNKEHFEQSWRAATMFAKSDLVPQQYRGKPENCMIAVNSAIRLDIEPIQFMQNTYIIHGKPGMEAKLIIGLVNERGPFVTPIQYKFQGEGAERSCTAYATHKCGDVCEATVTWKMVCAEGWNKKPGSKWMTMPDQMFQYRSATFLARLFCPEVILGFQSVDEIEDVEGVSRYQKPVVVSPIQAKIRKPVENEALDPEPEPEPEPVPTPEQGCVEREESPNARKAVCIKCQQKFWKKDLIRSPMGYTCRKCAEPKEESPLAVAPEERYYCEGCGHVDAECAKTGDGKLKCIKCFATKVIDRSTFIG